MTDAKNLVAVSRGVRVKALRWREPHPSHTYPNWHAYAVELRFEARIDTSKPLMYGKFPLSINGMMVDEKFETVEDAKAYAQGKFDEIILRYAASTPSGEGEEIAALRAYFKAVNEMTCVWADTDKPSSFHPPGQNECDDEDDRELWAAFRDARQRVLSIRGGKSG